MAGKSWVPFSSGFLATSVAGGGDQARSCNNGEAHGKNSEFTQAEPKEADWEEKFPKQEPQCAELEILQIAHGDLLLPRRWLIGNPGQNRGGRFTVYDASLYDGLGLQQIIV